ncbi:hypothetical protein GQ44DRAFT_830877 [Phaeosphaeriaceae sp. PMI808]|nr:hypothetical protein GQ44DRAFT_830877 [Phaeosphaeriaceae sp. PMI808]
MLSHWLDNLRKPFGRRVGAQETSTSIESLGLFNFDEDVLKDDYVTDIVAIHGLGGSYDGTWTAENGKNWLKDFLPGQLKEAGAESRVFSYGYNSSTAFSKAVTDLRDEAIMLLDRLRGSSSRLEPRILGPYPPKKNSKQFDEISDSFVPRADELDIRTFFETEVYLGQLVVPRDSAVMGLSKEIAVGVAGADHKTICKFSDGKSQKYRPVGTSIVELVRGLKETGTKEAYSAKDKAVLWISGDPGCGKSVLAKFLAGHLQRDSLQRGCPSILCHFFFSDDNKHQKNEVTALASIVHQILTSEPDLTQAALRKYITTGSLFTEFEALSSLFRDLVSDPRLGRLLLVLDAIDECNQDGIQRLLYLLQSLPTPFVRLKVIVTGRSYPYIRRSLSGTSVLRIRMEESLEQISIDVEYMITARVSRWAQSRQISNERLVEGMQRKLRNRADRTFLWVSLVLDILDDSEEDSIWEIEQIISCTPADLDSLYEKILLRLKQPEKAKKLFSIIVTVRTPLDAEAISTAWAIRPHDSILLNVRNRMFQSPENSIRDICGLFVRVINDKVYLVHRTAFSFLVAPALQEKLAEQTSMVWKYSVQLPHAHRIMATICLSLVLLDKCYSDDSSPSRSYRWRLSRRDNAMMEYAHVYWKHHRSEALWPNSDHPDTEADDDRAIKAWLKYFSQPDERLDAHLQSAFLDQSPLNNRQYRQQIWFNPGSDPMMLIYE